MNSTRRDAAAPASRSAWVRPTVTVMPRLTELTLVTTVGPAIPGQSGSGGGGVINP
ncbi:MAG TPA: hypothetical protein VFS20_27560 [Longimicrobium sp.]|nr:hypothetical protein [Longimicrobium sp.]